MVWILGSPRIGFKIQSNPIIPGGIENITISCPEDYFRYLLIHFNKRIIEIHLI